MTSKVCITYNVYCSIVCTDQHKKDLEKSCSQEQSCDKKNTGCNLQGGTAKTYLQTWIIRQRLTSNGQTTWPQTPHRIIPAGILAIHGWGQKPMHNGSQNLRSHNISCAYGGQSRTSTTRPPVSKIDQQSTKMSTKWHKQPESVHAL